MPRKLTILLDQNVPREIAPWLESLRPDWTVHHTSGVGLQSKPDVEIFDWAQRHEAVIVTFDEDFADRRTFPLGSHRGVVRLHVWPTTVEETQSALERLVSEVSEATIDGALIIIDRTKIRVRPRPGL